MLLQRVEVMTASRHDVIEPVDSVRCLHVGQQVGGEQEVPGCDLVPPLLVLPGVTQEAGAHQATLRLRGHH